MAQCKQTLVNEGKLNLILFLKSKTNLTNKLVIRIRGVWGLVWGSAITNEFKPIQRNIKIQ